MFALLFLLVFGFFGYLVMLHGHPLRFAGILIGINAFFTLFSETGLLEFIVGSAFSFSYTALVYMLIDRFSDDVFLPISILLGGTLLLFLAMFI